MHVRCNFTAVVGEGCAGVEAGNPSSTSGIDELAPSQRAASIYFGRARRSSTAQPATWMRSTLIDMVVEIIKIAAVSIILIGVLFLGGTFVWKLRSKGYSAPKSTSHFGQMMGAMPPTPKPDGSTVYERKEE